jgi:hypothetical protein
MALIVRQFGLGSIAGEEGMETSLNAHLVWVSLSAHPAGP